MGKSSILLRYVTNDFKINNEPTLGAAFMAKSVVFRDKTIKFNVVYKFIILMNIRYGTQLVKKNIIH